MDQREVHFDYTVAGITRSGQEFCPDGGGIAGFTEAPEWKAYYKPSAPEIAVLCPIPYKGLGWRLTAMVTGIMVGVHAYCGIGDFLKRIHKEREGKKREGE